MDPPVGTQADLSESSDCQTEELHCCADYYPPTIDCLDYCLADLILPTHTHTDVL